MLKINSNEKAVNEIISGIQKYVDIKTNNLLYDKSYSGVVVGVNDNHTYKVRINDIEYDNIKSVGGSCALNDTVKVLAPMNNYNNMVILGTFSLDIDVDITNTSSNPPATWAIKKYVDDLFYSIIDGEKIQW